MSIKQFLKEKTKPKVKMFQAEVDEELYKKLRDRLEKMKTTQRAFTEAAIKQLLSEG